MLKKTETASIISNGLHKMMIILCRSISQCETCVCSGHIQISQIPDRHEPSDDGTINFTSFFKTVREFGYEGWFAGEYYAAGKLTITLCSDFCTSPTKLFDSLKVAMNLQDLV